ncbi:hypothetical protein J2S19_000299 [Metabacillus malikii]|uniref:ROK family transcriptional regulator n=2 Tax=Metabacillus malikii TaxID=1504265 RepID=A0ABT9Z9W9_9BACI|nr:hypothetical protein [Metabacillus malikii]
MKKVILSNIRTTLIELGSATKVEMNEKLDISFPTISKFLATMEKEGEIFSVGLDESSGGRRAKRYQYNPEYMLGLAIFLERTETNYTIFNCLGEIKEQGTFSSFLIDDGLQILTTYIDSIMTRHPNIKSLAIGVPGAVDEGRIFHIPDYEQFKHFDIKGYFENYFSIDVVVENDMNAAVLGYHKRQGNQNSHSLIYLYIGQNGPGAGLLINGDVVRGSTFFAGEVSFVPQYDDRNFWQALEKGKHGDEKVDAISRLVASFTAMMNPHSFIFCNDDLDESSIEKIIECSTNYIAKEHLPELTRSDWKEDYLFGLQSLGLQLMINK